jgi:WD40 repeat protein
MTFAVSPTLLSSSEDAAVKTEGITWWLLASLLPAVATGARVCGEERRDILPCQGVVHAVAFSPDGKTLAVGGAASDKTAVVALWNVATRTMQTTLRGHRESVRCVVFSPDGKTLATASADRTVKLWAVATGKELATFRGHGGPVLCVAFDPTCHSLLTVCQHGMVKRWEIATRKERTSLTCDGGEVVALSPDRKRLATAAEREVKVWDLTTGKRWLTLEEESVVYALTFSADGKTLATGSGEMGAIRLWDVAHRCLRTTLMRPTRREC